MSLPLASALPALLPTIPPVSTVDSSIPVSLSIGAQKSKPNIKYTLMSIVPIYARIFCPLQQSPSHSPVIPHASEASATTPWLSAERSGPPCRRVKSSFDGTGHAQWVSLRTTRKTHRSFRSRPWSYSRPLPPRLLQRGRSAACVCTRKSHCRRSVIG